MEGQAVPQGSKSIVRGRLIDSNKNLKPWRAKIAKHVGTLGLSVMEGPIFLSCVFVFPRPKSHLNSKGVLRESASAHYIKKPDLDKLLRAIGDALSVDSGLLHDDSCITHIAGSKRYQVGDEPCGVHIELSML